MKNPPYPHSIRRLIATLAMGAGLLAAGHACAAGHSSADAELAYTGDWLHNVDGGVAEGSTLVQNVDAIFGFEPGGDGFFRSGSLTAHLVWNGDNAFSERFPGDAQGISNIEAPGAVRIYQLWYDSALSTSTRLLFGIYDLNSEFDAIESGALFLNGSHGMGAEYSQTGLNGPSAFPITGLGARIAIDVGPRSVLRYALVDGVPGDPDDPTKTSLDVGGSDGVLHAVEFDHAFVSGPRVGVGGYLYSRSFETIDQVGADTTRRDDGNGGVYAFVDAPLYRSDRSGRSVSGFLRVGVVNDEINPFGHYVGAGAVVTGLFANRPDDTFGVAVAAARTGSDFRRVAGASGGETNVELTYSAQLTDWLMLQPDIQYIRNPSADPALDDALVIGLRLVLSKRWPWR